MSYEFNATFSNISAISWRSVLVVEEAGVPREPLTGKLYHLCDIPFNHQFLNIIKITS
jgi:hypothetical protein